MRLAAALLSLLAVTAAAVGDEPRPPVEAARPALERKYFTCLSPPNINQTIANEIAARLRAIPLRDKDITVEVRSGGRAVITGHVGSRDVLMRVDRVVRQSLGVRLVENRLKVLSGPPAAEKPGLSLL